MKKGLAVIYDPHNVYQFLWYYCTYGKDAEWDALCLPNSFKGEYLSPSCKNLGVFKNVYTDDSPFDLLPLLKKMGIFIKMFLYALIGCQKRCAINILNKYVGVKSYDEYVVLTDVGFLSGLFLTFAKEKKVVILEDGMGDYAGRTYANLLKNFKHFYDVQGAALSMLGYSNIGHYYPLRTTKDCIKFCSHPEKMSYRKYKEMNILFDMTNTDLSLLKDKLAILYPELENFFSKKMDVIFFTTPLTDYLKESDKYVTKVNEYISANFKSVLLKKHPRDNAIYNFGEDVVVKEIPQSIPAEVLLPYLADTKVLFEEHSSTNLYMSSFGYNPSFIYFTDLVKDSGTDSTAMCKYKTRKEFEDGLSYFEIKVNQIIDL